jgi:hypothetical protein
MRLAFLDNLAPCDGERRERRERRERAGTSQRNWQPPDIRGGAQPWSVPRLRGRGEQGNFVIHT